MMKVQVMKHLFLSLLLLLVPVSSAVAYDPGSGDLFTASFSSGSLAPLIDYPVPAIGFGRFVVPPGEHYAWANGMYGRTGGLGSPGYAQSATIAPFVSPEDYSVAFRFQPEVPPSTDLYLFYLTLRPSNDFRGVGWQFNVDHDGKMFIRRYKGAGQFGPSIVESSTGTVALNQPSDQYLRCHIEGASGAVSVKMKVWNGSPQDEPAAWTIEGIDTDTDPLGGTGGVYFNVYYIPPLTTDPADMTTPGTAFDDLDVFSEPQPSSSINSWTLYH